MTRTLQGLLLAAWVGLAPLASGQTAPEEPGAWASGEAAAPQEVAVPSARSAVTVEQARARLTELEGASDVDAELVALYRQLVQALEGAVEDADRAEAFRQAIDIAPEETARVRQELEGRKAAEPEPEAEAGGPDATVEALQQLLTQEQAELAELDAQLDEIDRLIVDEEARTAQEQLVAARTTLAQIQGELDAGRDAGPEAPEAERVARELLRARKQARAAEIRRLDQELLSRPARLDLLQARREMALWSSSRVEERVTRLQERLSAVRQIEASRAALEAERARQAALTKHPVLAATAEEVADITGETKVKLPQIDDARRERERVEAQLARTEQDYELTTRSIDLGIGRELGNVLLELGRSLPDTDAYRRDASARSAQVAAARLRLFEVERELDALAAPERVADALLANADPVGLDLDELRPELLELLATKRDSLLLLQGALDDYLDEIASLDAQERALIKRAEELKAILAERLIWIPNAAPLLSMKLEPLRRGFRWLLSTAPWSEAGAVLARDWRTHRSLYLLVGLTLAVLLLARRRLPRRLEELATQVGRVSQDRIALTAQATLLQVLGTLPFPAALVFVGWRLESTARSTEVAAQAIGRALVTAFVLAYALQLLYDLCRRYGIARSHFHWAERTTRLLRRHLIWFVPIALATTFLVTLSQGSPDVQVRHGLGRLGFVGLMLATSALAFVLLHPRRGLSVVRPATPAATWTRRSRPFWMPLGMLVPLALAVIASAGYFYAALQLESRLNETLLILAAGVFLNAFALRWLKISQRRLALKVALERRAALAKKSEADEAESLATDSMMEALGEIDVAEIREQTQDLVRAAFGILVAVAVWFVWVGVLPALGVLDQVRLWEHEEQWITLENIGLSLLALLLTITAARNMPGFLEIAVLQRLPLEQGVRYATRTLILYVIVITGVLVAFNSIGIGWSSVQWLVAALTVGLGFGLQEIFGNFVSGLIILLERPVRVGDTVTVGQVTGVVTRIRMRATTITDWKRRELVVPNKAFITGELINWSLSDPILRLEFIVGIVYGSDTELAHDVMLEACHKHPMVLDAPEPNVFFVGFGDNSLNFEVRVFVNEPTNVGRSRIVHDLHMAIDQACRKHGIVIAFPQRDLHLKTSDVVWRVAFEPGAEARPQAEAQPAAGGGTGSDTHRGAGEPAADEPAADEPAGPSPFRVTRLQQEVDESGGH